MRRSAADTNWSQLSRSSPMRWGCISRRSAGRICSAASPGRHEFGFNDVAVWRRLVAVRAIDQRAAASTRQSPYGR